MFAKYFTPQEANQRLPLVKRIVGDILIKGKKLKSLLKEDDAQDVQRRAGVLEEEIGVLMAELEELGCFFKDWNFEIGLVDFPALIEGREVFLCWRSDEENISWYHPVEEGYASRQPIPQQFFSIKSEEQR